MYDWITLWMIIPYSKKQTRNNCFGTKIHSTTLRQVKTGKPECRCCNFSALVLTCFRLMKGLATYFRPETIVAKFLHLMVLRSSLWCFINIIHIYNFSKSVSFNCIANKIFHVIFFLEVIYISPSKMHF